MKKKRYTLLTRLNIIPIDGLSYKIIILLMVVFVLSGCKTLRPYQSPAQKEVLNLSFRRDELPQDSLSMADFRWREVFPDSLLQIYIQQVLDSNLDIRVALVNIEIAQAYFNQAQANNQPIVTFNPDVTYSTNSLNTQFGQIIGHRQHLTQYTTRFQASWEADVWGKFKTQRQAVAANQLTTISGHQAISAQLVAEVAIGYYQLLALDEQKKIMQEYVKSRSNYIEVTKALKAAGTLTEVAVKQSEAQLLNIQSQLVKVAYDIEVQENYIRFLMGLSPGSLRRSVLDSTKISEKIQYGVPMQLLENRPDVRMAEFAFMTAFHQSNAARLEFYPSFTISANTGLQSIDIEKLFSPTSLLATVVGGLAQPILNRRQIKTNYNVKLLQENISYLNWKKTVLQGTREVANILKFYESQTKIAELKQAEYEKYLQAIDFSQSLVQNGMGNYLEVILANEAALNTRLQYIQARLNRLNAQVQLYRALGGGWK